MERQYYYHDEGEQFGPFELAELIDMHIPEHVLIWHEGLQDWTPAGNIPGLQHLYVAPPPQQQRVIQPKGNPVLKFLRIAFGIFCLLMVIGLISAGIEKDPIDITHFVLAAIFLALGLWLILKKSKAAKAGTHTGNQAEVDGMLYAQGMNAANPGWEDDSGGYDAGGDFD